MSRIGRKPIKVPEDVQVKIERDFVSVKGPKGELKINTGKDIQAKLDGEILTVELLPNGSSAMWGTTAALLSNMIEGVKDGFQKKLEIEGIGYKAALDGKNLVLALGFSHPVKIEAVEGITYSVEKNVIMVSGIDKQLVGEVAARIRAKKKPEPYKGKGIHYQGEIIRRKAGKKAAGSE